MSSEWSLSFSFSDQNFLNMFIHNMKVNVFMWYKNEEMSVTYFEHSRLTNLHEGLWNNLNV